MAQAKSSEWVRGSMDLMVLSTLAEGPKYGYLIGQRLDEVSGGMVRVQAGTLYPLLHRLESDKLVRHRIDTSTGRRRKWYELTAAGERRLRQRAVEWHQYAECLRDLLAPVLGPRPDPA